VPLDPDSNSDSLPDNGPRAAALLVRIPSSVRAGRCFPSVDELSSSQAAGGDKLAPSREGEKKNLLDLENLVRSDQLVGRPLATEREASGTV
jgi:hypothetical protein